MKLTICDKCKKAYLRKELKEYIMTVSDITDDEWDNLRKWVASGNSAYDNPCYYSDDRGCPIDYISTMRVIRERLAEIESLQACPTEEQTWNDETDSPF